MNSLHALSWSDLRTLGTDSAGSHALQALVTSASDKGRGKFLRKLEVKHIQTLLRSKRWHVDEIHWKCLWQELYVQLACSRCGSRLLEAVWNSATISQRQSIAEKLGMFDSYLTAEIFI